MAELPYMRMYWSDYMSKTVHLSPEEHGAYLLILGTMWMHGGVVPDDDAKLARIARMSLGKWRKIAPTIRAFLQPTDSGLTQKRLQDERKISLETSEKKAGNAHARWGNKSLKDNDPADASASANAYANGDANPMQEGCKTDAISYLISQNLEERGEIESLPLPSFDEGQKPKPVRPAKAKPETDAEFEDWWRQYPRRDDKQAALRAYRTARKRASADALIAGAMRYAADCRDRERRFIKMPATWLNAGSWDNGPAPDGSPAARPAYDNPRAPGRGLLEALAGQMIRDEDDQ